MSQASFEFTVATDHPSLPGHFPGAPVVPGVLLLDQVFGALARLVGRNVVRVQRARFTNALLPGELATGSCEWTEARASFRVAVLRDGGPIAVAEGAVLLSAKGAP